MPREWQQTQRASETWGSPLCLSAQSAPTHWLSLHLDLPVHQLVLFSQLHPRLCEEALGSRSPFRPSWAALSPFPDSVPDPFPEHAIALSLPSSVH